MGITWFDLIPSPHFLSFGILICFALFFIYFYVVSLDVLPAYISLYHMCDLMTMEDRRGIP